MPDLLIPSYENGLPQLALFDLDGTLIDSAPDLADAVDYMLEQSGFRAAGEALVREWVGNGAPMLIKRALAYAMELENPQNVADSQFQAAATIFYDRYDEYCCVRTRIYAGAEELLQHWRDQEVTMGVVTNKPARFTQPILQALNLEQYFAISLSGDSLPVKKPDPTPLLHACEALQAQPQTTLMIGDSINDVQAARRAGMKIACVTYGYNHGEDIRDANPDWVMDSLIELK
ncbi:phosphoglycolate phosphatase [Hahella sp. NBU794]|uniref:phosphoglycolate phosphatase n=1 Tax=Hahella sp. NBU794 TaxID=3422590 RepID=UPI003D6E5D89